MELLIYSSLDLFFQIGGFYLCLLYNFRGGFEMVFFLVFVLPICSVKLYTSCCGIYCTPINSI